MKKSLFNTLGAIGIMALIALNVYVVTSKETPAFLKWDAMSYIFANGNSGSGSGDETENRYESTTEETTETSSSSSCEASVNAGFFSFSYSKTTENNTSSTTSSKCCKLGGNTTCDSYDPC